jgi:hypothetical protein
MKIYTTLSEIQRVCREVASTSEDYRKYNEEKKKSDEYGEYHHIEEWDAISIYSNEFFYVVCFHEGNILKLYRLLSTHINKL